MGLGYSYKANLTNEVHKQLKDLLKRRKTNLQK